MDGSHVESKGKCELMDCKYPNVELSEEAKMMTGSERRFGNKCKRHTILSLRKEAETKEAVMHSLMKM